MFSTGLAIKTEKNYFTWRGRHIENPDISSVWFSNGNKTRHIFKKICLHNFLTGSWHTQKFRITNVQVNQLRKNLHLGVKNPRWELRMWSQGSVTRLPAVRRLRFPVLPQPRALHGCLRGESTYLAMPWADSESQDLVILWLIGYFQNLLRF